MEKVGIVGVGSLPWRSRYQAKTARALALEVTQNAVTDAGLTKSEIDGLRERVAGLTQVIDELSKERAKEPVQD